MIARWSLHIPEDLRLISVDAAQIDRVLMNLLENAAKFSPDGSEISVDVSAGEGEMFLRVRNEGTSLSPVEQEQIFERFVRGSRRERSTRGTGLGLAICKGIVEAHGGRIVAEPDARGVTICVALPLVAAKTGRAAAAVLA